MNWRFRTSFFGKLILQVERPPNEWETQPQPTSSTTMKTKQDLRATCASCQHETWNKTTRLQ